MAAVGTMEWVPCRGGCISPCARQNHPLVPCRYPLESSDCKLGSGEGDCVAVGLGVVVGGDGEVPRVSPSESR